ncbi:hypothetical protein PG991_012163 [Apiospora marii]|uniref:Pheromone n=1 Tax=Apiospora marii TaxID=335849 RepID=A0ABR1R950_9PEZI
MAEKPKQEAREPQYSAMFEALATTSFEHDEICSLLPSQQHLPGSSSSTANSGSANTTGGNDASNGTEDLPTRTAS